MSVASNACGVTHNPDAIAAVRGIDTASWQYRRPAGVALNFQVSKHRVECQLDEATNVLNDDETGPHNAKDSSNFWPEVAVVCRASLLPGDRKGLTGDAPADKVNCTELVTAYLFQVADMNGVGPVMRQHFRAERIDLHMASHLPAHPCGGQGEAADARAELNHPHENLSNIDRCSRCCSRWPAARGIGLALWGETGVTMRKNEGCLTGHDPVTSCSTVKYRSLGVSFFAPMRWFCLG
jgi:hypothetical protein